MLSQLIRKTTGTALIAMLAMMLLAQNSFAQKGGTGVNNDEVSWPTSFTLGLGAAANDNWNGSGGYNPGAPGDLYTQSRGLAAPEFHILAEIPIAKNLMFAPRIAYNDYSLHWDVNNSGNPLVISESYIGTDLLFKWALSNFHLMAGANLSTPVHDAWWATSDQIGDAVTQKNVVPEAAKFVAGLKGGLGYDIPLNGRNTIWLTPEAFFTYSLTNYSQVPGTSQSNPNNEFYPVTLSGGASLKFALNGPPEEAPPPAAIPLAATITAHGIMPDGSITAEPVSPQSAIHTRSSLPLLPYVFFDEGSPTISSRYSRSGATGFSEQSALAGKDALEANHDALDVFGYRLKNNPTMNVKIVGTNSNSGREKNDIMLSKSRATAVADYLKSTWNIDPSRVTVDQRNLPELPTNPLTVAGQQENRRVEISSNSPELTAPIKIEDRKAQSVGATQVRYDITVSPDPSVHSYSSWTITLDKDGSQIGSPLSGSGAPPATTTSEIPDGAKYLNQPVHYTLNVTDANGQTAKADGYTRVMAKTVDRDNLEKYAMLSFDFDKYEINQRARQMLQLISESISRDATGVQIDGYCDATGTAPYNQSLSEARANSAVTALRSMTSLPSNVTVHGHGLRDPKFSNDLPEGRQLNRRVEFTIEKSSQ